MFKKIFFIMVALVIFASMAFSQANQGTQAYDKTRYSGNVARDSAHYAQVMAWIDSIAKNIYNVSYQHPLPVQIIGSSTSDTTQIIIIYNGGSTTVDDSIIVANTTTLVWTYDATNKKARIVNDGNQDIWFGYKTPMYVGSGTKLAANGVYEWGLWSNEGNQGTLYAITASGTARVTFHSYK